mgnify:CR=1 FL=1
MSHVVALEVVAYGLVGITQAVLDCGLEIHKQSKFQTDDGKTHEVDGIVEDQKAGAKVGVKVDAKTGEATFISYDCKGKKGHALAKRITQRWAYSKVVEELKRKGYEVGKEEKQADGTIKLVANKWK